MSDATVYRFRKPGQCCGRCMHMTTIGPGEFDHGCDARRGPNGERFDIPIASYAGTHCGYFRELAPSEGKETTRGE